MNTLRKSDAVYTPKKKTNFDEAVSTIITMNTKKDTGYCSEIINSFKKRLYIVDAKTSKMIKVSPEEVVFNCIKSELETTLNEDFAVKTAKDLTLKCQFPDLTGKVILMEEDNSYKEINCNNFTINTISIDDLLPSISDQDNIFTKAFSSLKETITDFSASSITYPVFFVENGNVVNCKKDQLTDSASLRKFLQNYLNYSVSEKLAEQITKKMGSPIKIVYTDNFSKIYLYNNGKMEISKSETAQVKKLLKAKFKYIPDLIDSAAEEIVTSGVMPFSDKRLKALNIISYDGYHLAVQVNLFGTTLTMFTSNGLKFRRYLDDGNYELLQNSIYREETYSRGKSYYGKINFYDYGEVTFEYVTESIKKGRRPELLIYLPKTTEN